MRHSEPDVSNCDAGVLFPFMNSVGENSISGCRALHGRSLYRVIEPSQLDSFKVPKRKNEVKFLRVWWLALPVGSYVAESLEIG